MTSMDMDGLRSAHPNIDWEKIESAMLPPVDPTKPISWAEIYGSDEAKIRLRRCNEGGSWHVWRVYDAKAGRVVWQCSICSRTTAKQVRVFGLYPGELLFRRNW